MEVVFSQEIDKIINNGMELERYKTFTPFSADNYFNLDRCLSKNIDYFFYHFYCKTPASEEKKEDLISKINSCAARIFILTGCRECGKTTFVRDLSRNMKNVKFTFFDFGKIRGQTNVIKDYLSFYMYDLISNDCNKNNANGVERFIKTFNNNICKQLFNNHHKFNVLLEPFVLKPFAEVEPELESINRILKQNTIHQLLLLLMLWNFSESILTAQKMKKIIVFDNLSSIPSKEIENLIINFTMFYRNINNIFADVLTQDGDYNDYSFIFICEESVKKAIIDICNERDTKPITEEYLQDIYPKKEIYKTRNTYLVMNPNITNQKLKNDMAREVENVG